METRTAVTVVLGTLVVGGLLGMTIVASAGMATDQGEITQENDGDGENETTDRTIRVTGTERVEAAPDEARLTVAVVAEGDDPTVVRDELANESEALRGSLGTVGVGEERMQTTDYEVREPDQRRLEEPPEDQPDYEGVHAFEVTLADVDRVGTVIDAAANASAEVRRVSYGLSEEQRVEVRDQAMTGAMEDARVQADTLATAGDLSVEGVQNVDASDRPVGPVFEDEALDAADGGQTELSPRDVTVHVTVDVTYEASEASD